MTPPHFRAGRARTDIRFARGECSLGSILISRSDRGVCAILLGDDPDVLVRDVQDTFPRANSPPARSSKRIATRGCPGSIHEWARIGTAWLVGPKHAVHGEWC
jgi:hypothetical protein